MLTFKRVPFLANECYAVSAYTKHICGYLTLERTNLYVVCLAKLVYCATDVGLNGHFIDQTIKEREFLRACYAINNRLYYSHTKPPIDRSLVTGIYEVV